MPRLLSLLQLPLVIIIHLCISCMCVDCTVPYLPQKRLRLAFVP